MSGFIFSLLLPGLISCNPDAKRLYEQLITGYNSLIRPAENVSSTVDVKFGLKLSQIIDVVSIGYQFFRTNLYRMFYLAREKSDSNVNCLANTCKPGLKFVAFCIYRFNFEFF